MLSDFPVFYVKYSLSFTGVAEILMPVPVPSKCFDVNAILRELSTGL